MKFARTCSDNIIKLLELNNTSIRQLAISIDIAPSTLTDSLKSVKGVPVDTLIKIAKFLNIEVAMLCDPDLSYEATSLHDSNILKKYNALDNHGKEIVDCILNKEYDRIIENNVSQQSSE